MLDKDMREPLFDFLDEYFGKIRTIEEKTIRKSRADVLGITDGAIIGFEIKSDSDTYERLKTQIKDYDKFCDYCYVVVGKSHTHVAEHIPDYWGIIVITQDEEPRIEREAAESPKVKLKNQMELLWKRELFNILQRNDMPAYKAQSRKFISDKLMEKLDEGVLKRQLTDQLFERDYTIFDTEENVSFKKTSTGVKRRRRPRTFTKHTVSTRRKKKN
jgi:hypothetical protein